MLSDLLKVTQLQSDSHGPLPREPRIKNSRARGIILPHSGEPGAQRGSVPFLQTHSRAVGDMGLEPAATQGPNPVLLPLLCVPSNGETGLPCPLLLLWAPHPTNCKHFVRHE